MNDNNQNSNGILRPVSTRLFVSNLNKDFTNFELQKIFSKVGNLLRCGIHWDKLGNSRETAEIEYDNIESAQEALNQFHSKSFF